MFFLTPRNVIHFVGIVGISVSCAVKQEPLESGESNIFRKPSDAELVRALAEKVAQVGDTEKVGNFEDRMRDVKVIRGTFKVVLTEENRKKIPWLKDQPLLNAEHAGKPCYLYFDLANWAVGDKSPSYRYMLKRGEGKNDIAVAYPYKPGFDRKKSEGRTHIISWHYTSVARDGYVSLDLDEESRLVSVTQGDRDPLPRNPGQIFSARTTDLTQCVFNEPLKFLSK